MNSFAEKAGIRRIEGQEKTSGSPRRRKNKRFGGNARRKRDFMGDLRTLKPGAVLAVAIKKLGARSGIRRGRMCFAKSWEASRRRQGVWSQCPGLSQFLSIPTDFHPRNSYRN